MKCQYAIGSPGQEKPPKEVETRTSFRTRRRWVTAICCATAPPNEVPSTCADSRPSSSRIAAPIDASPAIVIGSRGISDCPTPGGSNAMTW